MRLETRRLLQPVLSFERYVQDEREHKDERAGPDEPTEPGVAGVGHVLSVEAGDRGGHGDDRRPAGYLLGDDVEPVSLKGEVRLQDGRHQGRAAIRSIPWPAARGRRRPGSTASSPRR